MELSGQKILVTGASGNIGAEVARTLARRNTVYGLARFTDGSSQAYLEAAGVRCIQKDQGRDTLDDLPEGIDYIFNCSAVMPADVDKDLAYTFEVNAYSLGRLMRRYPKLKAFVYASSGSVYRYQRRPIKETDPIGDADGTYSVAKFAGEVVLTFASRQWDIPAIFLRIFQTYGPRGGPVTKRVRLVAEGKPVPLHPEGPNVSCPLYVSDFAALAERAAGQARVPPIAVNAGGTQLVSFEDYVQTIGRLLGVTPNIVRDPKAHRGVHCDTTLMRRLLGEPRVSVEEGIRRVTEALYPARLAR
jgi:nucleoside-diphosphate-sugar epimerase